MKLSNLDLEKHLCSRSISLLFSPTNYRTQSLSLSLHFVTHKITLLSHSCSLKLVILKLIAWAHRIGEEEGDVRRKISQIRIRRHAVKKKPENRRHEKGIKKKEREKYEGNNGEQ